MYFLYCGNKPLKTRILNMDNDSFEIFEFTHLHGDKKHFYRVKQFERKYAMEKNGVFIGEINFDERWHQISGEEIPISELQMIGDLINNHWK